MRFLKPRERRRDITASRREASAHQIPRCKLIDKAPLADGGEITLRQISRHRQFAALVQQFGKRQCRQGGQAGTLPLNRLSQCQRLFQKLPGKSRSEEHTSELQSLMRITYAVFCWKKKNNN